MPRHMCSKTQEYPIVGKSRIPPSYLLKMKIVRDYGSNVTKYQELPPPPQIQNCQGLWIRGY